MVPAAHRDLPYVVRLIQITVVPVIIHRHVNVADIALLQLVSVRHPMANHLRERFFSTFNLLHRDKSFGPSKRTERIASVDFREEGGGFLAENPSSKFE